VPEQANPTATGRRIALVLGAGGARGLAHIGIIETLEARGYRIGAISGSSMGALIGGIHAAGRLDVYRDWVCTLQRADVLRLLDFTFGRPGLIKGERVINALREMVGDHRIEELPIPYLAVATDLRSQREVWLTHGPLFDAIRASIAIPMLFTPHTIDGRELVDGGLLAPVPIAATRMTPADLVVAVDVNARANQPSPDRRRRTDVAAHRSEAQGVAALAELHLRIGDFLEGIMDKRDTRPAEPGLMQLMALSLDAMQARIARLQLAMDSPNVLVRVPHDACLFYEFWRARELIDLGRETAEQALRDFEQSGI
jgi:NTE family protein